MEPIVLITGFEPFGGETINPSWEAVQRLPERIGGFTLHKLQIPTVFEAAAQKVLSEAEGCQPRVILSVGQAGGRKEITPERIGVNLRRAATPDNAGNQPQGEGIVLNGPDGIFSTCPVEAMAPTPPEPSCATMCSIPSFPTMQAPTPWWALSMCPFCRSREAPACPLWTR